MKANSSKALALITFFFKSTLCFALQTFNVLSSGLYQRPGCILAHKNGNGSSKIAVSSNILYEYIFCLN